MSRIFRTMYQVPDLGAGVEERERPWRLTLEALRHPEQEEELLQQAIPPTGKTNTNSLQTPYQARTSQQALADAAGPAAALITPRHFAFLGDETFQLVRRLFLAAGDKAPRAVVFCAVQGSNAHSLISARDRKSTRLNSSHPSISYAVFCLKKKKRRGSIELDVS